MKILLISGHGAGDSGAVSQFGREADETIYMVKEIQKTLSQYVQVDLYPTDRNAYSDAKAGKLAVNFGNYGYVLEVHFNACVNDTKGDGKTTGTEIFVTKAEKTVGVETKIVQAIAAFGLKNRGVEDILIACVDGLRNCREIICIFLESMLIYVMNEFSDSGGHFHGT